MWVTINSYKDIKALSIIKELELLEVAKEMGYTSIWGLKVALKNKRKKDKILKKAYIFFENHSANTQ
ncbi:hypothetical protein NRK67_00520 [Fusobacteria bacterium ZRK30]|nr:hypothetical protein NRK67_00520 [Fusobacteria bacterium ZRK30]